jgi:hypothetical protein
LHELSIVEVSEVVVLFPGKKGYLAFCVWLNFIVIIISNEDNKKETFNSHEVDPLDKLPCINNYDMDRLAYLLGQR